MFGACPWPASKAKSNARAFLLICRKTSPGLIATSAEPCRDGNLRSGISPPHGRPANATTQTLAQSRPESARFFVNERRPVPRCGLALRGAYALGAKLVSIATGRGILAKRTHGGCLPVKGQAQAQPATVGQRLIRAGVPGRSASEPEFCTTADSLLSHQSVPSRRGRAGAPSTRRPPA
jgi:hypothetical protein